MRCQDYLCLLVETISDRATILVENMIWRVHKGWGLSAKLGKHSAIWGKLGTALLEKSTLKG